MRVGIIQPNYMPWRGYFDFIDDVDLFIFLDDVQYTRRDWRNRNRIKSPQGLQWLTVPVHFHRHSAPLIADTPIDYTHNWQRKHINSLKVSYGSAPYFAQYGPECLALLETRFATIAELNIALTRWMMAQLAITTPLKRASTLQASGAKTARLIDILQRVGATIYLSGPAAKDYLEPGQFDQAGIALEYKTYAYQPYPQRWGSFQGAVSALDLLFNCGPQAPRFLKSQQPNLCAMVVA